MHLIHTSQPGSWPQGIETQPRTPASRTEARFVSCKLQLPLLALITQLSIHFEISFKNHGYLQRRWVFKLQHSHYRRLSCVQVAKLHRASSTLHLWCCSVLQAPLYCCFLFHKCNSQAAILRARLQHYLLFEIMALGSSKALGDRKHWPIYSRFTGKDKERTLPSNRAKHPAAVKKKPRWTTENELLPLWGHKISHSYFSRVVSLTFWDRLCA